MKLHNRNAQVRALALIALLGAPCSLAEAQQSASAEGKQIPAGAVACNFVGRAFLSADFSHGEVVGYFTDINGIGTADSLFDSSPGEQSAYFTFRSNEFSLRSLPPNGDVGLDLVSGGTFNIYYNPTPNGDWNNPDTFSGDHPFPGRPIAHFMRPEVLFVQILQSDVASPPPFESISEHAITETLVSSQSFTFGGHQYDLSTLLPAGVTLHELFSNAGVSGVADLPIGLAFAGNCLAVASEGQ